MAYSTDNPPVLLLASIGNVGASIYTYGSADAAAVVDGDGYISNAKDLGIKAGDVIFVTDTDTNLTTTHVVLTINADGSADLGDGTTVGGTTDTD